VKTRLNLFFLHKKAGRFFSRLPKELRIIAGLVAGGLIGLLGGIAGLFIGLVLGYLIQELLGQFGSDREIHGYYENPGMIAFNEGVPGLAAFCGLGIHTAVKFSSGPENAEMAITEVSRKTEICFAAVPDKSMIEHFCRIAWLERESLNPDLLAESLAARLVISVSPPSSDLLGKTLSDLAASDESRGYVNELMRKLDPHYKPVAAHEDPWKILGVSPEISTAELKNHYRRLAAQFHPDALQGLDDDHLETASRAFIAIREAYMEIIGNAGSRS